MNRYAYLVVSFVLCILWACPAVRSEIVINHVEPDEPSKEISVPDPENNPGEEEKTKASGSDMLVFINEDKLHGRLVNVDPADGVLRWLTSRAKDHISFLLPSIKRVGLAKRNSNQAPEHKSRIELTNEDVLTGDILSIDKTNLVIDTWYAGKLKVKRSMLAKIAPNTQVSEYVYRGPSDISNWNVGTHSGAKSWAFKDGSLMSLTSTPIGRKFENLPDKSAIHFRASWIGYPSFYLALYTDNIDQYHGNTYLLRISSSSVYLQRYSRRQGSSNLGSANISQFSNRRGHGFQDHAFDILVDKEKKEITMLVDRQKINRWVDASDSFAGLGKGILFQPSNNQPFKISDIRIKKWDGTLPGPKTEVKTETKDMIVFSNGDKVSGSLVSISEGKASFQTDYAELSVPVKRIASISMADETRHRARRNANDITASFSTGGKVTVALKEIKENLVTGSSENFGSVKLRLEAFNAIAFNIYNKPEEKADGEAEVEDNPEVEALFEMFEL